MLFMATYIENGTTIIHDSERHSAYHQVLSNAGKIGVRMRGIYVNAPAHTMFFLFEADNAEQIEDTFKPIRDFGHIESVPVVDRLAY